MAYFWGTLLVIGVILLVMGFSILTQKPDQKEKDQRGDSPRKGSN